MQDYFHELSDVMQRELRGAEVFTAKYDAEDSDFVRFNHNSVRQAGAVKQAYLSVDLVNGQRHAAGSVTLSGTREADEARVKSLISNLRELVPHLPEDPHLLYATDASSSERLGDNQLPDGPAAVDAIVRAGGTRDLVGIYSSGGIYAGFSNSLGQRNWFSTYSFNLDWSTYLHGDKAVKSGYAGFEWNSEELATKMSAVDEQLAVLGTSPRTIDPGTYRAYLSPAAMYDILGTLSWTGFGLKDHRTKQTSLLKMIEGSAKLAPAVAIRENTAEGVAPNFQSGGFIKPPAVPLIQDGCFANCLASPRSAKEYGVPTNGASNWEMPESIDMAPGQTPQADVLKTLDTGLYINNVWYLNYSDRPNCRMTGMTRFATFWVENGQIAAPVNVMRFDETIYRLLGEHLIDLTRERDFILDPETYDGRSTASGRLPGALVDSIRFTL